MREYDTRFIAMSDGLVTKLTILSEEADEDHPKIFSSLMLFFLNCEQVIDFQTLERESSVLSFLQPPLPVRSVRDEK